MKRKRDGGVAHCYHWGWQQIRNEEESEDFGVTVRLTERLDTRVNYKWGAKSRKLMSGKKL